MAKPGSQLYFLTQRRLILLIILHTVTLEGMSSWLLESSEQKKILIILNHLLMVTLFRLPEDNSEKDGLHQTMITLQSRRTLEMAEPSTADMTSNVEEVAEMNIVKQIKSQSISPESETSG